jgi:hypothetical protein
MSEQQLKEIADNADMIIANYYAVMDCGRNLVNIIFLNSR